MFNFKKTRYLALLVYMCGVVFVVYSIRFSQSNDDIVYNTDEFEHTVKMFYEQRREWKTSNLGSLLYLNASLEDLHIQRDEKQNYVILVWSYYEWLNSRHGVGFNKKRTDPFDDCSVKNCILSDKNEDLATADAVLVHVQRGKIPGNEVRKQHQRWIFLTDESPVNSFSLTSDKPTIEELANVFNWSMNYRSTSDIPVPYGRTVPFAKPLLPTLTASSVEEMIPHWSSKKTDVFITIMMSNCVNRRMDFIKEISTHIDIDTYGKCFEDESAKRCPGHFRSDCPLMSNYYFYLVLENAFCDEYMTEKIFYNAYYKGSIPVISGPSKEDCERFLPPQSYLHVDDFASIKDLAEAIKDISGDVNKLLDYHVWRNYFEVKNEHGYFDSKSQHYCRVCEALNFNDRGKKIYGVEDLRPFFDTKYSCR